MPIEGASGKRDEGQTKWAELVMLATASIVNGAKNMRPHRESGQHKRPPSLHCRVIDDW